MAKRTVEINYMQGNQACAEGAVQAGCNFFAANPGSPYNEILKEMAKRMQETGGIFLQMEDETSSIASCIGASMTGKKVMTATSGNGLSLMSDNLGFALASQTPCVIVDVQHAGPSMGQITRTAQGDIQQARWAASGDYELIVLSPWSAQEMYDLTIDGFNLSEKFNVPVLILADETIGHIFEKIKFRKNIVLVNRHKKHLGQGLNLSITGFTHDGEGNPKPIDPKAQADLVNALSEKISSNLKQIIKVEEQNTQNADVVLVACGSCARSAMDVVLKSNKEGLKTGLLRLVTLWPFADEEVAKLAGKKVVVVELNKGQLAREVKRVLKNKVYSLSKTNGELVTPSEIIDFITCLPAGRKEYRA